jgi:hypothetical protein
MVKITPDPPHSNSTDCEPTMVERTLAIYVAQDMADLQDTLVHAIEFLRCAIATAYEVGDALQGSQRKLAFTVMHMVEMGTLMVERALECIERAEKLAALVNNPRANDQ